MKKFIKLVSLASPVFFLILYVSKANTFLLFVYLIMEGSMLVGIIYGVLWMFYFKQFKKTLTIGVVLLILSTHITRILWMLDLEGLPIKFSYFLKGYLFEHVFMFAGNSLLLALIGCFIIGLTRLSGKKRFKVLVVTTLSIMILAATSYMYINRDLSKKGLFFEYSINSIEEVKELAREIHKTVYVDFWHSGCAPCLKEFANHKQFSGLIDKNNVHFLFIGVDRSVPGEKSKQRILIEKYDLKGTHTFITKEEFDKILDGAGFDSNIHGFKAFPHHMIINRYGEIMEIKADKPSPAIASKLNSISLSKY